MNTTKLANSLVLSIKDLEDLLEYILILWCLSPLWKISMEVSYTLPILHNLRIKMLLITLLGQYDATHIPLQFYYNYLLFVRFLLITTICGSQINFENVLYFCNPVVQTNKINKKINNRLY